MSLIQVLHVLWQWGGYAAISLVSAVAFWRGGWAERTAAAIILPAWLVTPLLQHHFDPGVLSVALDGVTALGLLALSFAARRIWTLLASASMTGAFLCHFAAGLVQTQVGYFAYITALGLLGGVYLVLCLIGGLFEHAYLTRRRAAP